MCEQFETDIFARSRLAREKANIPIESTKIPDYRQLLLTKKFAKFTRCTCDHSNHSNHDGNSRKPTSSRHCRKHPSSTRSTGSKSSTKNSSSSSSDYDDDEEQFGEENSSSSPTLSYSSETEGRKNRDHLIDENQLEQGEIVDEKVKTDKKMNVKLPKETKFDDIRSMELHRKQNHPERLHPDLSFNEPDQVN